MGNIIATAQELADNPDSLATQMMADGWVQQIENRKPLPLVEGVFIFVFNDFVSLLKNLHFFFISTRQTCHAVLWWL